MTGDRRRSRLPPAPLLLHRLRRGARRGAARDGPGSCITTGTAMLHCATLARDGHLRLPDGFHRSLADRLGRKETADEVATTILGLLGATGDRRWLPVIRRCVDGPAAPEVLRSAIGALGLLGEREDITRLEGLAPRLDPSVTRAAAVAIDRLQARTGGR